MLMSFNKYPSLTLSGRIWVLLLVLMGISVQSRGLAAESQNPPEKKLFGEVRAGILAHDVDHLWSNLHVEGGIDFNLELVFFKPSLRLLSGIILPNVGVTVNSRGYTSKLYAGFLWEWKTRQGLFLDLGLGVAIHDGELNTVVPGRKLLGRRVLFRIPVEVGYRLSVRCRVSLMFSHVSNGYTAEYNQGLDVLGLRIGYRF